MGIPGALRPRSNTEILDAAFALARRCGAQLLPISLLIGLPISLLTLRFVSVSRGSAAHAGRAGLYTIGFSVLVTSLESLRLWVLEAAMAEAILNGQVSWPAVRRRLSSVFWRLVGSVIALIVLGGLCSIPVVVPGVIFVLHRFFFAEVLLVEGKSVRSSFRRSFALTDDGLGRLGWFVLAAGLISFSLSWGISAWAAKNVLGAAVGWIGTACLVQFKAAAYLLAYFDRRSRQEGADLLQRDAELAALRGAATSHT
jgi:hypothetical protein